MYAVFSVIIYNFVGAACSAFVAGTTAVSLIKESKAKEDEEKIEVSEDSDNK